MPVKIHVSLAVTPSTTLTFDQLLEETLVKVHFAGDCIGEDSLLRDRVAPWTAMAGDWCELMKLRGEDFRELCQAHPELLSRVEMHARTKRAAGADASTVSLNARCHEIRMQQEGFAPRSAVVSAEGGSICGKQRAHARLASARHLPAGVRPALAAGVPAEVARACGERLAGVGVDAMKAAIVGRRRLASLGSQLPATTAEKQGSKDAAGRGALAA